MKQISLSRKLFILNQRNLHLPKTLTAPKLDLNAVTQHRKGQASCQECLDHDEKSSLLIWNYLTIIFDYQIFISC